MWQSSGVANGRFPAHIRTMRNVYVGMPMVEVVAPDGSKSLWAAAVTHDDAVAAVKKAIPADHVAKLSNRRITLNHRMEGLRLGQVCKVKP